MKKKFCYLVAVMVLLVGKVQSQSGCGTPLNVRLASLGQGGAAAFVWNDTNSVQPLGWLVEYGQQGFVPGTGTSLFTATNSAVLTGLVRHVSYQIYVRTVCRAGDTSSPEILDYFFYCGSQRLCIDYASLSNAVCTYGTYHTYGNYDTNYPGPYANVGLVDHGPWEYGRGNSVGSLHTVVDQPDFDESTNYQLTDVPLQECESVRLGGRGGTNQCQAIKYTLVVDTNLYDALAIRYATVMKKGNSEDSPARFTIELMNGNDSLIAPVFDVNPYNTQGWQIGADSSIVWRPWNIVGLDFRPYHDSVVNLRFTTFHCGDDSVEHFGYAYYSLNSCMNARLLPAQTFMNKDRSMVFKAPDGFRYKWFLYSDTANVIDTDQVARIPHGERFGCRIFDGFGHSRVLSSMAYERTPHAGFTATVNMPTCTGRSLILHGRHFVTIDSDNCAIPEEVDFYHWIVDGEVLTDGGNLDADLAITPGVHTVSFVTGLSYNGRTDTMTMSVTVPDTGFIVKNVFDTIDAGGTYVFGGETLTCSGIYSDTLQSVGGCDSIVVLNLTVKNESTGNAADLPEIKIYPNPVRNVLTIETLSDVIEKLEVIDNAGRTQMVVTNVRNLDLSGLEDGIYHIRMTTLHGVVLKRIVKQ